MRTSTDEDSYYLLNEILNNSKNTVFLGGAGVSTESGIPDFRSKNGLYHRKSRHFAQWYLTPINWSFMKLTAVRWQRMDIGSSSRQIMSG